MFNLINSHQQEFIYLLNQRPNMEDVQNLVNMYQNSRHQDRPEPPKLKIGPEDEDNINTLVGITGYDRQKCIKGYLVCGKDLDLAAS